LAYFWREPFSLATKGSLTLKNKELTIKKEKKRKKACYQKKELAFKKKSLLLVCHSQG
jgi:hypothetical protein